MAGELPLEVRIILFVVFVYLGLRERKTMLGAFSMFVKFYIMVGKALIAQIIQKKKTK